ncbi:MAG: PASTA domain-containing protein [Woeseiaceae bacterium]
MAVDLLPGVVMSVFRIRLRLFFLVMLGFVAACSPTESDTNNQDTSNTVTTPDTSGLEQDAAQQAIRDAGLRVGTVTSQSSDDVPIGSVVRTDPRSGTTVSEGSTVNIVVSSGTASVPVPETAGSDQAQAETSVGDAGLTVAAVATEASNVVPVGQVIRSIPVAGELVARGGGITLVVSTGPADVSVPDVVNLVEAAASTAITDATLLIGTVTGEASDVVPFGRIIEQVPVAGAMVSANTDVDLTVSLGPANIAVPDVTSLTEADAIVALEGADLVAGEFTTQASVDVAAGAVISQNPAPGALVAMTTAVDLVISVGPNPLPVPDIVSLTEAQALVVLANAGLEAGVITRRFDNNIPQFEVISQATPPGTLVVPDTTLDFVVSLGPPVSTPNVVGLLQADAELALVNANLVVGVITEANDFNVPLGQIISQDPNGGTVVPEQTVVDLVVSLGPPTVAVPDVVGLTEAQARAALVAGELIVGNVLQQNSDVVPAGQVISQTPVAAEIAIVGSAVDLVVSLGPVMVDVPNVAGLTRASADSAFVALGLVTGTVTELSSDTVAAGRIISQNPVAGTSVVLNTAVAIEVSTGPAVDSFSDEFSVDSLVDWTLRHQAEGTAAQYTVLDINQSTLGELTIVPTQTPGWFENGDAPLVFKLLSGDFSVHTRVLADSVTAPGNAPSADFNSAGLMARDADGATDPENHVMLNVGRQDNRVSGGVGSETKTTVDGASTLFIDQGSNSGDLVLCRIGDDFFTYRRLSGETDWTLTQTITRADLPLTLQVGMVANAFAAPADLNATFDFIRLLPAPAASADCTP